MRGKTLLVTGAHGLVGQYIFKLSEKWNGRIIFTGRGPSRLPAGDYVYEEMDITDKQSIHDVFARYSPDVVIHAAAMAQADECEVQQEKAILYNVTATSYLLAAAAVFQSFFLFLSTDFIFSGNNGPYDENAIPEPVNFYGQTKLMAEEQVKEYPFGSAIIRTVLIYGNVISGTRSNIISWARSALEKAIPFKVVSDQIRATTYAADLVNALFIIAEKKSAGIWNIAGKNNLSPYDIVQHVAAYLKLDASIAEKVNASTFTQVAQRPLETAFIIEKARRELNYEPHHFEDAMQKVLNGD